MSKPDAYMPFYALDFFQAVRGESHAVQLGYLKAITHYWFHTHCKGLPNDSEKLRRICELDKDEWKEAHSTIFDNEKFFLLDHAKGVWIQKRSLALWNEALRSYEAKVSWSKMANKARWSNPPPPRRR